MLRSGAILIFRLHIICGIILLIYLFQSNIISRLYFTLNSCHLQTLCLDWTMKNLFEVVILVFSPVIMNPGATHLLSVQ